MSRFDGTGVLVTGASRGLGRAIAEAFGAEGAFVGVAYRTRREAAEETVEAVRGAGGDGVCLEMDVRDEDSVRSAVGQLEERSAMDVLVNNAGVVQDNPLLMLSPREWAHVMDVNLTGTYTCCRAALPSMMARRRGAIVNVSSVAAIRASPGQGAYSASKGGILALTRTLAKEACAYGIRVNAVVPGLLETGMVARLDRRRVEEHTAAIPLGRLGTGSEAARVVLFLASDEASYVLGQAITVDGGLTL